MNHCGNDVFRADKLCEKRLAFLKKAPGILWGELFKKGAVRGHNQAAHTHGVLPHGLDQQEVVNAILDGLGVILGGGFMQIVVVAAPLVINIRVGTALPLPVVVALDSAHGLFFELIHV